MTHAVPDAIPRRRHVVHIGMHKSATTAIQRAATAAREELAAQGVVYPGSAPHHSDATAVLWNPTRRENDEAAERDWRVLVEEIAESGRRAFVSAEHLAPAAPETIRRMADDLGGDVEVVVTVRNFVSMLPSIWQQYVKERRSISFEDWLTDIFDERRRGASTPNFWPRHDLGELATRWSEELGPDRVTVVVLDRAAPDRVFRAFEEILEVRTGTLTPQAQEGGYENRGLSLEEVELLRLVNQGLSVRTWTKRLYLPAVRGGMVGGLQRLRVPDASEGALALPDRWLDAAVEVAGRGAREAAAAGVRVVGDLDEYARRPRERGAFATGATRIPAGIVGAALAGIASRAVGAGAGFEDAPQGAPWVPTRLGGAPLLDAARRVSGGGTPTLRVLAGADVAASATAAGLVPAVAHALAARTLHRGLLDMASAPGGPRQVAPFVALPGQGPAFIAVGWGSPWSPREVTRALDALPCPVEVTVELPDLADAISVAWERGVCVGGHDDLDSWVDRGGSGWAGLPDARAVAALVETIAAHPAVAGGTVRLALAPRTTRRLTATEHVALTQAAASWRGLEVDALTIAKVMLLGAVPALKRARPFDEGAARIGGQPLHRLVKARRAAARRIGARTDAAGREVLAAWMRQSDDGPGARPDETGRAGAAVLAADHAAEACLGAVSVAMGRGAAFDHGVDRGWIGASRTAQDEGDPRSVLPQG